MSDTNRQPHKPSKARVAHRGQTIIIALAVLFVLFFIGALFVARVGSNIQQAGRSREVQTAQALAEAGVQYCDAQLTNSPEGADWRPTPTPPITTVADTLGVTDPDYEWLSKGFARVEMKGGRYLVRVSYDPNPGDPRSQLLRIESVGRVGDLAGGNDPTVFVQANDGGLAPRLRRELVAYKQIGLTDYLHFITDRDRLNRNNAIGMPPIGVPAVSVYGNPNNGQPAPAAGNGVNNGFFNFSGGIRSNSNLTLMGDWRFYPSLRGQPDPLFTPEGILVAGDINFLPTRDANNDGVIDARDQQALVQLPGLAGENNTLRLWPSDSVNFTTVQGLVRDGRTAPDNLGYNRGSSRLTPPDLDAPVIGTNTSRYRALARESGVRNTTNGRNTGVEGWGSVIYVNNPEAVQRETNKPGVQGGYSLRADWLNPNAQFSQGFWQGPFYRPPGVLIELLGDRIRLTRDDNGRFNAPDGSPITEQGGKIVEIPLSDEERRALNLPIFPHDGDEPPTNGNPDNRIWADKQSYGVNVVLFAEGNVRVKGVYGSISNNPNNPQSNRLGRVHLTIVSGATAYIDGNVVKGDGSIVGSTVTPERGSTCAIMAKDYVCLNTTQFMAPSGANSAFSRLTPDLDTFYTEQNNPGQTFDMTMSFGINPSLYQSGGQPSPVYLLMRHSALTPGPAIINLLVNPGLDTTPNLAQSTYQFDVNGTPATDYTLGLKPGPNGWESDTPSNSPLFEQKAFPLPGNIPTNSVFLTIPGFSNVFRWQLAQNSFNPGNTQQQTLFAGGSRPYLLGGAMVAPLDIRVEAMLYAQDKSFFVIPGYWFNPDPTDTRANYIATGRRPSFSEREVQDPALVQNRLYKHLFPFYGEPMDVRITVFGSITENYTASVSDQSAWMSHWGYLRTTHGSTGQSSNRVPAASLDVPPIPVPDIHLNGQDPTPYDPGTTSADVRTLIERNANITRGLRFVYDPALAMPYGEPTRVATLRNRTTRRNVPLRFRDTEVPGQQLNGSPLYIIRQILPPIPRLPTCPGLLYYGAAESKLTGSDFLR